LGLDVGGDSITQFCASIEKSQTIVWNGPVGVFEFDNFAKGSRAVLDAIVMATERGATSIIGKSTKGGLENDFLQLAPGGVKFSVEHS
jgi:phosphoglycerate kinase